MTSQHPNNPPNPADPNQYVDPADVYPQAPAEQDRSFADRLRGGLRAAGSAIRGMGAASVTSDLRQGTRHSRQTLYRANPRQVTHTDPFTGVETTTTQEHFPLIPVSNSVNTPLLDRNNEINITPTYLDASGEGAVDGHPLYRSIFADIKNGDFRPAVAGAHVLETRMRNSILNRPSLLKRGINSRLSEEDTRESQLREAYANANHSLYDMIMSVPNRAPNTTGESAYPGKGKLDARDWSAELNPWNVQELRAFVMKPYVDANGKPRFGNEQYASLIETGGMARFDSAALAAYLNVDRDGLRAQIIDHSAKQVVSPDVLTKLNFLLCFADNAVPTRKVTGADGRTQTYQTLPLKLAFFNDTEPDSSPMDRVRKRDEPGDISESTAAFIQGIRNQGDSGLIHVRKARSNPRTRPNNRRERDDRFVDPVDVPEPTEEEDVTVEVDRPDLLASKDRRTPERRKQPKTFTEDDAFRYVMGDSLKINKDKKDGEKKTLDSLSLTSLSFHYAKKKGIHQEFVDMYGDTRTEKEIYDMAVDEVREDAEEYYNILLEEGIVVPETVQTRNGEETFYPVRKTREEIEEIRQRRLAEKKGGQK